MEIYIEEKGRKRIRFVIKGGDYTLGNLIQEALLSDERVEGAGYHISHPLLKEMIFEIRFKKSVKDPFAIVKEDLEKFKKGIVNIKKKVEMLE